MTLVHTLLHFTWCLPQTLLGLIIKGLGYEAAMVLKDPPQTTIWAVKWLKSSWFSLGRNIFAPLLPKETTPPLIIQHELGHSKQSLILGPLYLLIIGLPSLLWYWWYYAGKPKKYSYYAFYTERWANRLAGIDLK